jgi:hypothetical protein
VSLMDDNATSNAVSGRSSNLRERCTGTSSESVVVRHAEEALWYDVSTADAARVNLLHDA